MIKAVLFDLDGTLVNTNNLILQSFKYTLNKHLGISPKDSEITKYFGEPLLTTLERYDMENAKELFKTYIGFNEKIHDEMIEGIDGAYETLCKLREMGIKLAVVTSKRRVIAERGLKIFDMLELMDSVVTVEDTENKKPHGEPVTKACELLEISPEDAIMVGDSHFDILCGKNGGAKTCLVSYTAANKEDILKYQPDFVIDKLWDLIDIVQGDSSFQTVI